MISVSDAFSVEEVDSTRRIAQSVQVAWKKDYRSSIRVFAIGVSAIGGNDIIGGTLGATSDWSRYLYQDESSYVQSISYERHLSLPTGGISKALAEVDLDNTSGRFTPRYLGGSSSLYTVADKPRRPLIINAGFEVGGVPVTVPQFVGITTRPMRLDSRSRTGRIQAADFLDYLENKVIEDTAMFTNQRTDQLIAAGLSQLGYSTAQYDLDYGINVVPFAMVESGGKWGKFVNDAVEAEFGHLWQDEEGRIRFQNRQAWNEFPYFNVQRVISTNQVISWEVPDNDQIINVVEVKSKPRAKQPTRQLWALSVALPLNIGSDTEVWVDFSDPVISLDSPVYAANTSMDGTGTPLSEQVTLKAMYKFSTTAKLVFSYAGTAGGYLTQLDISGRAAKAIREIYTRVQDDSSVTAYEEQGYSIENDFIQDDIWAKSMGQLVLNDFAEKGNQIRMSIRAIPELQLGDLISWQGRYWRIFGIRSQIDPAVGFIQELSLIQRTVVNYFRIGISTIGGTDRIAA